MDLHKLLYKVELSSTVWISENPGEVEGIYFGPVGDIKLRDVLGYKVVTMYPKCFPFEGGSYAGLTIVVKKENEK